MSSLDEYPPTPITTLTPELIAALRERTQTVLSYLAQTNSISTYFKESEILSSFRDALHSTDDGDQLASTLSNPEKLFQTYHDNVALSVYEHYLPFVSRFFEQSCKTSSVENLMAPGLPYFIAHSSGTSGGATKHFPKYRHPEHMSTSTSQTMQASNPVSKHGGKNCIVYSLGYRQVISALNEDGEVDRRMPVCLMSTGTIRMYNNMPVEKDPSYQTIRIRNSSSPLGVSFIPNYKSFLFMHALFALQEPRVELINTMFSTIFRDFCRVIDEQWETLVECVNKGSIPELEGIDHVKDNLQRLLPPSPGRADELRKIGRVVDTPGWFTKIWPGLRTVVAISSGPFATVVPELRHYIGPEVVLQTLGINCSEAFLALAYDHRDASLYKVVGSDDIIEFLPIDSPEESKYLTQTWNVELGKKYEVVLTTRDGFWRYRLGDVIDVVGFDPRDGQPVIHYLERRNVHIRLANEITTENQLRDAIASTSDSLGVISEFCVSPDYRESMPRYGFFVEAQNNVAPSAASAPFELHTYLQNHNENYLRDSKAGKIGLPVIRVLRQGTFSDFREWKIRTTNVSSGQVKVPSVIWDEGTRKWLEERVVEEF
ncbi:GH3 auxin-responsive promoter [Phlebopus sp. FC_14]|nr:GH3 auxin-responsive promoter [Phlebopus sp. FC_14]